MVDLTNLMIFVITIVFNKTFNFIENKKKARLTYCFCNSSPERNYRRLVLFLPYLHIASCRLRCAMKTIMNINQRFSAISNNRFVQFKHLYVVKF